MSHTKSVVGVSVGDEWPHQISDIKYYVYIILLHIIYISFIVMIYIIYI